MALADFTAAELSNITNSVMDFYMKGDAIAQTLQNRPLYEAMKKGQSTFPGAKESIRINVKGEYTSSWQGYSYDDTVEYKNPANIKQANYQWFEQHLGISMTHTELKTAGITVVDTNGERTSQKSGAAVIQITDILKDKLDDMAEGGARSFNLNLWRDGTADAKMFPGIRAFIRDNPAVGVVGGIDASQNVWWRNRARTAAAGTGPIVSNVTTQALSKFLRSEIRQITKFGGKPSLLLAGSGFIEKLEAEIAEKGLYTQSGFTGKQDITMGAISLRDIGTIQYDPTLDDEGLTNRLYAIDPRHLKLKVMDGEDMKQHNPARPAEKYVLYRAVTWTGGLVADQLNCHGVYDAA